jgi:anti-sigma B factor antagonist
MEADSIHILLDGAARIVELHGEHDLSTADAVADALRRVDGAPAQVVVDLTAATFIDSSVLGALARAGEHARTVGGAIAVVAPAAGHPRRVLDLVGLERRALPVVETRADALRLVAGDASRGLAGAAGGKTQRMKDEAPDDAPGVEVPQETSPKAPPGTRPIRRPDPDRVTQGDEAAEREAQRAREDVSEGGGAGTPSEPENERADRMAERGLETRPSVQP